MRATVLLAILATGCSLDLGALHRPTDASPDQDARADADARIDADAGNDDNDADASRDTDGDAARDADVGPDGDAPRSCPGDIDGDFDVDADDGALFVLVNGSMSGMAGFDERADFNDDGVINGLDFGVLRAHLPSVEYAPPECVPERCAFDFDGDDAVGSLELAAMLTAQDTVRGDSRYDPHYDFDAQNGIDAIDVGLIRARVGHSFDADCSARDTGTCPFDIDGDDRIDASDHRAFTDAFLSMTGDPLYDVRLDFTLDGTIDDDDATFLRVYYGAVGLGWPRCPSAPGTCAGDLDHDGDVDRYDVDAFAAGLGADDGETGYDIRADSDFDGTITLADYREAVWNAYGATSTTCRDASRCRGDVDDDGDIDSTDASLLDSALGTTIGQPAYEARADIDGDGDVDSVDLSTHMTITSCS